MGRTQTLEDEKAIGLTSFLTETLGIGGRLRSEAEDFRVIELGNGPKPTDDGKYSAARVELRNWETNRFAGRAANILGINRGHVGFAGMKDKRAVTEQWFTFKCHSEKVPNIEELEDVRILEGPHRTHKAHYAGAHTGNRFVLRVREHAGDEATVASCLEQINKAGGTPNVFGPQRFGSGVRPITPRMGEAIVAGDLQEAVRLYVGCPYPTEHEDARAARQLYEDGDVAGAHAAMPHRLDHERAILARLLKRPGEWRYALQAMPKNLLQLFVHSRQSLLFNRMVSARIDAGLGINVAHIGDRVMPTEEDGHKTSLVTEANQARIQAELDKGRAVLTAPLIGMNTPMAEGKPGEIERQILDEANIDTHAFRCLELPEVASDGVRRGILMPIDDLECEWVDGDPVVSFSLGRGSYATVVMREVMKTTLSAY
jgi:tRNA pseudouridine13 synthase